MVGTSVYFWGLCEEKHWKKMKVSDVATRHNYPSFSVSIFSCTISTCSRYDFLHIEIVFYNIMRNINFLSH